MLLQITLDSLASKTYFLPVNGVYKAHLKEISLHDDLGNGQHRLVQISSPNIKHYGDNTRAIRFTRDDSTTNHIYDGLEFELDLSTGAFTAEVSYILGGASATVITYLLLTLDVESAEHRI